VVPLTGFYVLFLAMLTVWARRQAREERTPPASARAATLHRRPWPKMLLRELVTVAGGYVTFVALIGAYVLASGGDPGHILQHAVRGGALLAFGVVVPGFALLSGAARVWDRVCRRWSPTLGWRRGLEGRSAPTR